MRGAHFVPLPVHRQRSWSEHLHPVHADIPNPTPGILRDHHRQRDIRAAVFRPARDDWQAREVDVIALENDLLARGLTTSRPRRKLADLQQPRQHGKFPHQSFRNFQIQHLGNAFPDLVEIAHAERQTHPLHRSEEIDRHRVLRPLAVVENDVFEVERLAAARLLHHAIRDLADLQARLNWLAYTRELSDAVDRGQKLRYGIQAHLVGTEVTGRSPTWIAATPNDRLVQVTAVKPARVILPASSSSTGKLATDRGRYWYAVR